MSIKSPFLFGSLLLIGLLSSTVLASNISESSNQVGESEQSEEVLAVVLGKPITVKSVTPSESERLQMRENAGGNYASLLAYRIQVSATNDIISALRQHYAKQNNIVVDSALQQAFVDRFSAEFNAKQSQPHSKTIQQIAYDEVLKYATEKAMYEEFGGRVVFTQSNPQMPVDAYKALLKRYKDAGQLNILDEDLGESFWSVFSQPYKYVLEKENIDFSRPWWL